MSIDYTQFLTEERLNKIKNVVNKRQNDLTIVLENIIDPHNMSACLRSCDATGVNTVNLVYDGSQPYPKPKNTSSASASKWIDFKSFTNIADCYKVLKNDGFMIYTTALTEESVSLYDIDFTPKIALVFGNEHSGCSESAIKFADGNFLIPQVGMIQSLNISVACAVSLYEAFRQRKLKGYYDSPNLSKTDILQKINLWSKR